MREERRLCALKRKKKIKPTLFSLHFGGAGGTVTFPSPPHYFFFGNRGKVVGIPTFLHFPSPPLLSPPKKTEG
ncbi:unnamed protein product, partial [Linum tenue]